MKPHHNVPYRRTVFRYLTAGKPKEFWFITAYNPGGDLQTPAGDNLAADRQLHAHLAKLKPFRINAMPPCETSAEPGWGVVCDEANARKIGRKFGQLAVVHFHKGRIVFVDCKTGQREVLKDPGKRILDPRDRKSFSLFVGSPGERKKLDPLEYAGVCTRIGALFPAFTIQRAEGCFQSHFEESVIIHLANRESLKVITLAHDLRCFLNQDGIGISHGGIYQRITDWTDDAFILEAFGIS